MPKLSPNAIAILKRRYLLPRETPNEMFTRVAADIASVEEHPELWDHQFWTMMTSGNRRN
ncbi:MAG: hypothetical protein IIC99_08510 [Chloroflexi bacterium]|nr:hypothetical protein [Chloroflexota bacterium]